MRERQGGGVAIALGVTGGALIGAYAGQASIGILAGMALGIAAALFVWLRGRRA